MVNPVGAGLWVDGEGGAGSRAVVATTYQPAQKYFTTVIFDPLLPRTRAPGSHLTWRRDTSGPLRKGHLSWSIWLGGPVGCCSQAMRGASAWQVVPDTVKVMSTDPGTGLLPPPV